MTHPLAGPCAAPAHALAGALAITAAAEIDGVAQLALTAALDRPAAEVRAATLHATALGIHELRIGGVPVTDSVLNPGWTTYEQRLQVQCVDVTALVRDTAAATGELALTALLADGWYRGDLGFRGGWRYGDDLALLAALEIEFADGTSQRLVTDESWRSRRTAIVSANLYHGQHEDRRREPGPDAPVRVVEIDRDTLVPQLSPPVLRHETLAPQRIWTSPSGRTLLDFGQNLVGWLRLHVTGPAGTEIVLRHAEVLEDGELGTRPLRTARATDRLILAGHPGGEDFEPTLTVHGFRYAEITGWPGELGAADVEAVVVHSQLRRTGWFTSSHAGVNRLIENSVWSQRGNFLSVPTDCPQRDERLGWTGDIAAYAATAAFQFDVSDFLHSWLLDLEAETRLNPRGIVPFVVPDLIKLGPEEGDSTARPGGWGTPTAIWGDASVWVPEALWRAYGDLDQLRAHYPAMVRHLDSVERALSPSGLWDTGFQFADWLDPDAPADDPARAKADKGVVATACLVRSARFAAETAQLLADSAGAPRPSAGASADPSADGSRALPVDRDGGSTAGESRDLAADAQRWRDLADRTLAAFTRHYVGGDGIITSDCTTVYSLAIAFDLLEPAQRERAGERLAQLVREAGHRVSTGFAGTPFITWALSATGHLEEAYGLLLEEGCPSWLYPISMGATTIWERWDSMLPDGSINPGEMTSFNHYALGAVADWIHQVVLGIRPAAPGYRRIRIQPTPGPGIDWVRGAYDSAAGRIEVSWEQAADGALRGSATIPDGTEAEIVLPGLAPRTVGPGTHPF